MGNAGVCEAARKPVPVYVHTTRGDIEYSVLGEGPAVMALHGAMGGYDQSDILARTVGGPGFRFLAVSRPGYLGTALSVGASPEEQADSLAGLLDALGIGETAVVAVSGGGPSAIHFALRHPKRCRALVLISTVGGMVDSPLPFAFHVMKWLARFPAFSRMMRKKAGQNMEQNLARSISDPEILARTLRDAEVRPLLEELTLSTFDRMGQRMAGTVNDIRITRNTVYPLEQIAVPTLVVHGTADRLVPFEQHGKVLAERIPGAELLKVEGGEHVAIFTERERVRARVMGFLRDHCTVQDGAPA